MLVASEPVKLFLLNPAELNHNPAWIALQQSAKKPGEGWACMCERGRREAVCLCVYASGE